MTLKTTLIENIVGYHIHLDPCPMLIVQPKDASALQFSKERVAPFIKATPVLRRLVGTSKKRRKRRAGAGKSRDAGETIDYKAFPGGFVGIVGAGSPDNLARRPIRIILFDEVDKYLPIKEGNPIVIGEERLATFDSNSLSVAVCSPTITGESKIEDRHAQSDQRRASVECPLCGHRMFPEFFRHVDWSKGQDGKTHRPETSRPERLRRRAVRAPRAARARAPDRAAPKDPCSGYRAPIRPRASTTPARSERPHARSKVRAAANARASTPRGTLRDRS